MRKKGIWLFVIFSAVITIGILCCNPEKEEINRTINCTEVYSQESVDVVIDGTYYAYFLSDDHFIGTIKILGKRTCTRDYVFQNDVKSFFVDDVGQPIGTITQYHMFETLVIAENDYVITSDIRNGALNDES